MLTGEANIDPSYRWVYVGSSVLGSCWIVGVGFMLDRRCWVPVGSSVLGSCWIVGVGFLLDRWCWVM